MMNCRALKGHRPKLSAEHSIKNAHSIIQRWEEIVRMSIPDAHSLTREQLMIEMVPRTGLEPACFWRSPLKRVCLPIPPPGHRGGILPRTFEALPKPKTKVHGKFGRPPGVPRARACRSRTCRYRDSSRPISPDNNPPRESRQSPRGYSPTPTG